jgi:hypothetical protein
MISVSAKVNQVYTVPASCTATISGSWDVMKSQEL